MFREGVGNEVAVSGGIEEERMRAVVKSGLSSVIEEVVESGTVIVLDAGLQ